MRKTWTIVFLAMLMLPSAAQAGNSVTRWTEVAMQVVRDANVGTPQSGRLYAMVTAAMYDAVNGIDDANGVGRKKAIVTAAGAPANGNGDAAVAAAAHAVLKGLTPSQTGMLDAALAADLAALGADDPSVVAGRAWGEHVGARVLTIRSTDGTQMADTIPAGSAIGVHRASLDARFRHMAPFGVEDKAPYLSPAPPALTSPEYAAAFDDIKTFGQQDGDAERNAIANFWQLEAGTGRETGAWWPALIAITAQEGTDASVSDTARLFAYAGMAIGDAVMVTWDTKATYFTWRPFFAVREAEDDGNPDTIAQDDWTPRNVSVGASPEYNSGMSAFAGAVSKVIEQFYCNTSLAFCFKTDNLTGTGPRCYASALEAAEEAGRSRILQGIHFQFSNEDGRRVGRGIGDEIATKRLRRQGESYHVCPLP